MLNIKIPCILHKVRVAIKIDYLVHLSYKNSKGKERVSVNFKEKLEHTRKYAEAFWHHEMIDRPYVCVTAPKKPHKYSWSGAKSFRACMEEKYDDILRAGQPRSIEWMDLLTKIQSAGKSLWIFDWTAEEIKANVKHLKPELVAFSLGAQTPEQADDLLEYLEKLYR